MGKKRIVNKTEETEGEKKDAPVVPTSSKKHLDAGVLYVHSTFNNTKTILTDKKGNVLMGASAGGLGFKGAKKGTPFAAAKVGEELGTKAALLGLKSVDVIIKGIGSGRESAVRGFISKGAILNSIKDETPVPHNGPKPKKARRV